MTEIPAGPTIIASGPLTSPRLSESLRALTGQDSLFFFDAISPILTYESINMEIAFRASRYTKIKRKLATTSIVLSIKINIMPL
jgi:methylenetetrahydrofolate--tRNA-(uracil-5-)-methyltransferase